MKTSKTTKLFILGTIAVLAVVFLSTQVFASSKPEVKKGEILDTKIKVANEVYVSPIFETDFRFNLAGFAWQGQGQTTVFLRFYNADGWSGWHSPESEDYFAKDGWYYNTEPIFALQAEKIQYKVNTAGNVERLRLIYVSTKGGEDIGWK